MLSCFKGRRGREEGERAESAVIKPLGKWRRRRALEDKYKLLYQVGEGKTGQVFVATRLSGARGSWRGSSGVAGGASEEVAVKIVTREYLSTPNRVDALREELTALGHVRHPHALKLLDVFEEDERVAIVTELARGGEVLRAMCGGDEEPASAPLMEGDVAAVVRELLQVVAYLHARGITHRDVKVENIMSRSADFRDGIVLIDFGLAHRGRIGRPEMTGMNGTPHYMAPEMFVKNGAYGCEIDLWAVGVVTYILLFGQFPFDARFLSQVEDKIIDGAFDFPPDLDALVSHDAKKFIEYLLVVDPANRPPASLALQHPWLQADATSSSRELSAFHVAKIRSFLDGKKTFERPSPLREGEGSYVPPALP
jgi:serine/threonine protein kinase